MVFQKTIGISGFFLKICDNILRILLGNAAGSPMAPGVWSRYNSLKFEFRSFFLFEMQLSVNGLRICANCLILSERVGFPLIAR